MDMKNSYKDHKITKKISYKIIDQKTNIIDGGGGGAGKGGQIPSRHMTS